MPNPAESYESYMVPVLFGPAARRLVDAAHPRPGERVLDVGCGTGAVARLAAPLVGATGRVAGVDLSPDMLAVARAMAAQEGLGIEWREGRAEALPYPDDCFDAVLCQYALMFFADRSAAVAEMRRVLAGGGRIALAVWQGLDRHPFYQVLDRTIEHHLGTSSVRDIFSLGDPDEIRRLLAGAGFSTVEVDPFSMTACFPDPAGFLAGEIDVDTAAIPAMQHLDGEARAELTARLRADMEPALRAVTTDDRVRLPFHAHLVRARA